MSSSEYLQITSTEKHREPRTERTNDRYKSCVGRLRGDWRQVGQHRKSRNMHPTNVVAIAYQMDLFLIFYFLTFCPFPQRHYFCLFVSNYRFRPQQIRSRPTDLPSQPLDRVAGLHAWLFKDCQKTIA